MSINDGKRLAPISRAEACLKMSKLVRTATGVNITEPEIDKLFREHWLKLSITAHQIHNSPEPPR